MSISAAFVQASTVICGMLCLLFGWMRWRHRDPGTGWFSVGFVLVFAIFALGLRAPPEQAAVHRGASLIFGVALLALGWGLVDYSGAALERPTRWRAAVAAPVLIALLWGLVAPLPREAAHLFSAASLLVMAAMAWTVSRREPGAGMRLVMVAMLLHPMLLLAMLLTGADVYQLRYLLILPLSATGMTLFAVSLTRARLRVEHELAGRVEAQRALQRLNDSLEHRVAERTAELHDIVAGLESFNRSVSHDLRGPLGGMAALSRLAMEALQRGDTAKALNMLGAVAEQADALGTLVTDLLLLARVNDATLVPESVDLARCVDAATEQLRLTGLATDAVEAGPLADVQADAGLLRQVFVNLIGNALKFSRQAAHPAVRVELIREPARVVVAVRDNGAGFDPQYASDLFEPFRRLHGGRFEGSGIGLTIVRRIVERHGGAVWAEGRPGQGASFYFALPLAPTA
jgi:signal transduction histidine kinase